MDIVLFVLGLLFVLIGVLGSFLPVLPGPPLSWAGLLLLHLTGAVPANRWFLGITAVIALVVFVLDYMIPALGTKRSGGTRSGMIGTTVGLLVALLFPVLGIIGIAIWPFVGAFAGELIGKADRGTALRAAFGSFLGFLTGTFLKFLIAVVYLGLFVSIAWQHRSAFLPFLD